MAFKSCVINLMESLDHNHERVKVDHFVDVVFTDFSKAFDLLNHNLLMAKLGAYGFNKNTLGGYRIF